MAITLATPARNAACDAITALLNVSGPGNLQIATTGFASILATFTLSGTAFAAASVGVAAMNGAPLQDASADNTGTAAVFRYRASGGTAVITGAVKTADDGTDITLDVSAQNAALTAINTLIGTGGGTAVIEITTAADTTFAASPKLATLNLNGTNAFNTPSAGSMAINGSPTATSAAAGTAGLFRILNKAGAQVLQGTVGTSGADMNFVNNIFGVGSTITITGFTMSFPSGGTASSAVMVFGNLSFTSGETVELTTASFAVSA